MALLQTKHGPIYYHVKGEGPPLLLLHGLSRSSRHWIGFDRRLAKHFKVITMDARGIGRTRAPARWWHTTCHLADDAAEILKHLQIKKAHVFGLSLGGMVALTFGVRHPRQTQSLIVVNTSIGGIGHPRLLPQAALAISLGACFRPLMHPLLVKVCLSKQRSASIRKRIIEQWRKIEAKDGVPYGTTLKQMITAFRFRLKKDLQQLKIPTLVVYGAEDSFVSHGNSKALSKILPKAELCCIADAGHEISIDKPQELTESIVRFVGKLKRK